MVILIIIHFRITELTGSTSGNKSFPFKYIEKSKSKLINFPLIFIGDTVDFAKNNLQMDKRNKTSLFNGNNFTDIHNFKLR